MMWIYRFFRKSVIGLQMKKRATVMAARFHFLLRVVTYFTSSKIIGIENQ